MIIKDIGHHTCSSKGGEKFVIREAPFLSEHGFLGKGYYFWQNNLEFAKIWGHRHYNGKYYVLEFELNVYYDELLDLVGNRTQMMQFKNLIYSIKQKLAEKFKNTPEKKVAIDEWGIGEIIEYLKRKNIFEYKIIKAVDYRVSYRHLGKESFLRNKKNFIFLNPRIFYCFIEKNNLYFSNKKLIYTSDG